MQAFNQAKNADKINEKRPDNNPMDLHKNIKKK